MTQFTKMMAGTAKAQGRTALGKQGAKLAAKHVSKAAAKTVTRTLASPWLLVGDVVEFGTEKAARALDCDETTVTVVSKGAGLVTCLGAGAAAAGPPGILVGAGLWAAGQAFDFLFG